MIVATVAGRSALATEVLNPYLDALARAGATTLVLPPAREWDDEGLERVLDLAEGLLLAGGGDILPSAYGQVARVSLDAADPNRDRLELRALALARAAGKRVLGICRGAQLLAVAAGGSLLQDLPIHGILGHRAERADSRYGEASHSVKSEPGSLVEQLLDGLAAVNSQHHQAIENPGSGLVATAWSPDGATEAVEGQDVLGIQWHPEFLIDADSRQLRPFRWLVHGLDGVIA